MTTARWRTLLAELKRRKVFRVAAVYGAAAFVVIQAADIVFPRLALPDWTVTLVVALAVFGLLPALALAWAPGTHELAAILAQPRARRWPAGLAALGRHRMDGPRHLASTTDWHSELDAEVLKKVHSFERNRGEASMSFHRDDITPTPCRTVVGDHEFYTFPGLGPSQMAPVARSTCLSTRSASSPYSSVIGATT